MAPLKPIRLIFFAWWAAGVRCVSSNVLHIKLGTIGYKNRAVR
jgi:hypothetical protein